jgi:hypothetical protein
MKLNLFAVMGIWLIAIMLIVNFLTTMLEPRTVFAQKDTATVGRYQVSAWAAYSGGSTHHYGYYIIDTTTGKVFDKTMEEHIQTP